MKALVTIAARFIQGSDGRIYPEGPAANYDFFSRYLEVFEEVLVVARVRRQEGAPPVGIPFSDGPGVTFVGVPTFSGIWDMARHYSDILAILSRAIDQCRAYFLRVPDFLGTIAWKEIGRRRLPFAVEVVGDPADSLQKGSIQHPLRPLIRFIIVRCLRAQCAGASASSYVTKQTLQNHYPPGNHTFTTNYSSINLPSAFFRKKPLEYRGRVSRLVFVGTLEALYKGQDILLEAMAILARRGSPMHLTMVGDGRLRPELAAQASARGLASLVNFMGNVSAGPAVVSILDANQVFILPSRQEGLPRAMIEAMARGLPCIGSTAGGIPELLAPEDMVPPGNAIALANKISEVVGDPAKMSLMSARNLSVAQEYRQELIQKRRLDFYRYMQEIPLAQTK
jgi:glycosyltransferase involved in cell wall biosynthesis